VTIATFFFRFADVDIVSILLSTFFKEKKVSPPDYRNCQQENTVIRQPESSIFKQRQPGWIPADFIAR
jgi:hypothetical protein